MFFLIIITPCRLLFSHILYYSVLTLSKPAMAIMLFIKKDTHTYYSVSKRLNSAKKCTFTNGTSPNGTNGILLKYNLNGCKERLSV